MSGCNTQMSAAIEAAGLIVPRIRTAFLECVRRNADFRGLFQKPPTVAKMEKIKRKYQEFAQRYNDHGMSVNAFTQPEIQLPVDFLDLANILGCRGDTDRKAWFFLHSILKEAWVTRIYVEPEIEPTLKNLVTITVGLVDRIIEGLDITTQHNIASLLVDLNVSLGGNGSTLRGKKGRSDLDRARKLITAILSHRITEDSNTFDNTLAISRRILEAIPKE